MNFTQHFLATLRLALGLSLGAFALGLARGAAPAPPPHDAERLLVRFKAGTAAEEVRALERDLALGFLREIPLVRVRVYQLSGQPPASELRERLRTDPRVELVELDHLRSAQSATDPYYPLQWALHNTGQTVNGASGSANIDINWPEAMARFTGTTPVVVAVVDSGVASTHPDLLGNMHVNSLELYGLTGVDDDGNGIVDDFMGYDFFGGDVLSYDENGHGTQVASLIASLRNNGLGVAGVAPVARILPLRVLGQLGQGGTPRWARLSDLASALAYAAMAGARVINLSLGGSAYSQTEAELFAILNTLGVLVVAAAGNGGADGWGDNIDAEPFYPAAYGTPNLLVVAAQGRSGGLAPFSNYGVQRVHLAAPGVDLLAADINRRTLFNETFENPQPGWTAGSGAGNFSVDSWQFAGSAGARYLTDHDPTLTGYLPYANLWARSPLLDLRGVVGARLEFESFLSLSDDWLFVEASADGFFWQTYSVLSGLNSGFGSQSVDLSDLDGLLGYFRFRLVSNGAFQGLGVGIDNVRLSVLTPFDQSAPQFRFNAGTSFAAPLVSGVAALLLSQRPDLTVAQVRACLLDSVRPVALLSGKVATGGMLDANEALRRAALLPSAPAISVGPKSQTVPLGGSLLLTVEAVGTAPLAYQWRKGGVAVAGATAARYSVGTVTAADAGTYAVLVSNAAGSVLSAGADITIGPAAVAHMADTNGDFRIGLLELTRMVELYNVRNAGSRTGCYRVEAGTEDGFAPEPARAAAAVAGLARHHSADTNRDGRIGLLELTRVIELYNYRAAGARTGQYRVQSGTEDGFAPGA